MCGSNTTNHKNSTSRLALGGAIALSFSGLFAMPAAAQMEGVLEEIIVTAQKREQSLEDVPASVSAISGDSVNDYLGSAENIRALAGRVPSLQIESSNGRTQPRFYIRGLGNIDFDNNANQPVAMVFDDVALENNVLRSLPLYDIQRVEVLKGPQGSLFGRNTNAGLVKIDSVKPSFEYGGYAAVSYGDRNTVGLELAVGGALSETVAVRVAGKHQSRDNWIDNLAAGTPGDDFGQFDETALRALVLWQPSDKFSGLFKIHGFNQDGTHPQIFYANAIQVGTSGLRDGFDIEKANHDGFSTMDLQHKGASANLTWDFGDSTVTSITAYDSVENFQAADVDGGLLSFDPADIGTLGRQVFFNVTTGDGLDDHRQITQEFRVATTKDGFFTQVGVFYFDEDIDVLSRDYELDYSDIVRQKTKSFAVFGQVDYSLTDEINLIIGGRWTNDDKNLEVLPGMNSPSPADTIDISDDYFNWDVAINFQLHEDWSWYGRVANASRGPVTLGRFGFTSSADTETSTAFEIGFKSTLLDGRARWSAAAYSFQNDDHQLTATGGAGNVNQLLNAHHVNGLGIETDLEILLSDNFRLIANASYNDTEIDDPELRDDLCGSNPTCTGLDPVVGSRVGPFGPVTEVSIDGNPLPRTPNWIANLILQYDMPMASGATMYVNTDWNYRGESNIFLHRSVEFVAEKRTLGGVRIGYRGASGNWDLALVGRNITNEIVVDGALNFLNLTAFVNEPRYWGGEFRYDFGN
ncbi:MAG: TonB-dependent receptor [Gammaproteobacteria bacterium]|nr:TonB-dependent receptor [Gammaproteobacteria bacterium]